jgi:hypothetical protein
MKVVHRKFKDAKGADAFEKYTLEDIDADEAVARHPKEYSFEEWKGAKDVKDLTPPPLEVKPELLTAEQSHLHDPTQTKTPRAP